MAAFADDDYPEISEEEKLAIASQLLLASPPGEITEVLADVRALSPAGLLSEDVVAGVFRRYNNQTNQVLRKGGRAIVCDEAAEIDAEHYMDFASGRVVKVDHAKQVIVDDNASSAAAPDVPSALMEQREAVEAQLLEYVQAQYVKDTAVVSVCARGSGLVAIISGEKLNLKNFWGGRWQTKFAIDLKSRSMDGMIKLRIHYFEDGNVQMTTEKSVDDVSLSFKDAESLGQAVRDAIAEEEGKVQGSLEEMYVNMSKETFKDMRRVLPITRQKMDWSGAQLQLAKGFTK